MDVHTVTLLDDLQPRIGGWHFCLQLPLLALEGIDAHNGMGILKELVLLEEPKGEAVLPHHQFGSRDQYLERLTRRRGEFGSCRGSPRPRCDDNAPKEYQHENAETQEPSHRYSFLVRQRTHEVLRSYDDSHFYPKYLQDNAPSPEMHKAEPR